MPKGLSAFIITLILPVDYLYCHEELKKKKEYLASDAGVRGTRLGLAPLF
jgi:hypothetical protein